MIILASSDVCVLEKILAFFLSEGNFVKDYPACAREQRIENIYASLPTDFS